MRIALIVIGIVLVACIGGGFLLFHSVSQATGPVKDAASAFTGDLEAGNNDAAYGMLCTATQDSFSRAAFIQGVTQQPKLTSHEVVNTSVTDYNGQVTATVTMNLKNQNGFTDQHTFRMIKQSGVWKVCGSPY